MHAIFMPYGKRAEVELLLRDMEAQKHFLPFKEGGGCWIQGVIRSLPFGVYEYIFPRADKDLVLHTLDFDSNRYSLNKIVLSFIRKAIKADAIPQYEKTKHFLWIKDNVNIIPIGIREDIDFYDKALDKNHEAL
jgi:hypothetical protein